VVHAQRADAATSLAHAREHALVRFEIGVAPAVDRLLGIADQEQSRPIGLRAVERKCRHDRALARVGVLELVDEQLIDAPAQIGGHARMVGEQRRRAREQLLEAHAALAAQPVLRVGGERGERGGQQREQNGVELLQIREQRGETLRCGLDRGAALCERVGFGLGEFPLRPFLLQ
jgi:hypothetical protein